MGWAGSGGGGAASMYVFIFFFVNIFLIAIMVYHEYYFEKALSFTNIPFLGRLVVLCIISAECFK
jgi:hypothetical protein